jgi:heparosan-N-sulfate-glucuronate 5-epimerase
MSIAERLHYYQRIFEAYLLRRSSHLNFWHDIPRENPNASIASLGEYYMPLAEKANYAGPYDAAGIPMIDYRGRIGVQYNPIAIAQWGLGNFNLFRRGAAESHRRKVFAACDWLCANLRENQRGVPVWNHHFDWEYRKPLKAPWYSGLAQGQGISLLVRAYYEFQEPCYLATAVRAFFSFQNSIGQGGVSFTDQDGNVWFEEYVVSPPTHILNGFIWAAWGVYDYFLATQDA